jgi:hypothetical protein
MGYEKGQVSSGQLIFPNKQKWCSLSRTGTVIVWYEGLK